MHWSLLYYTFSLHSPVQGQLNLRQHTYLQSTTRVPQGSQRNGRGLLETRLCHQGLCNGKWPHGSTSAACSSVFRKMCSLILVLSQFFLFPGQHLLSGKSWPICSDSKMLWQLFSVLSSWVHVFKNNPLSQFQ